MSVVELAATGMSKGHIRWISIKDRVPDTRRQVLAWGTVTFVYVYLREQTFLGVTRFNPGSGGSPGDFDCERLGPMLFAPLALRSVTHWAEIVGPARE